MSDEVQQTLNERGARYGKFIDNAEQAQRLQEAARQNPNWNSLPADCREAITVILQKIANASTVYKSRYVEVPASGTYQVCISVEYILKNGAFGGAPGACNPALPE